MIPCLSASHFCSGRSFKKATGTYPRFVSVHLTTTLFSTKESVLIPREEYIIVPNQHEPIIDPEEFDKVQEMLRLRKYNKRHGFENIFSGLVFCLECGTQMNLIAKTDRKGMKKPLFKCFNHYKNPEVCTHYHAVLYDDLYEEVLKRMQLNFTKIKNSDVFDSIKLKLIDKAKAKRAEEEKSEILKELSNVKKNISSIYKAPDKNIGSSLNKNLLNDLLKRQNELTKRLTLIECGEKIYDIDGTEIKKSLEDFLNIQSLNEDLVSKFIKRIEIGETLVTDDGPMRDSNKECRYYFPCSYLLYLQQTVNLPS